MRMKKKLLSFLSLTAIAIFAFAATQSSRRAGDPVVLWSSETPVEVTWGTSVAMQDASVAADWNVGDILAITVNSFDTSKDPYPQVGIKQDIEGWPNVCPLDASVQNQTMPYVSKFYITADMLAKLKANQFFISGTAATVSKLEYIKDESGTDYSNAIWIGDYKFDGWSKFFGIDKSSFASVKEGDKIEFRLTEKGDGFILQPFLGGWSGTKINTNDDAARFSIDGNIVRLTLTADDVTALKTGGMVLQGADFTIRAIALPPVYAVNVATDITNGTVEVDMTTAVKGETVTVTATPAAGYKLCNALARGVTTDVAVEVKNGKFTMPADAVTVSATFEKSFAAMVAAKLATVTSGEVTFTLDADYTVDAAVNVPVGKQLVIDGSNHTLTMGAETNFALQDGITLKNLKIDASALTKPLIAMGDTTGTGKHNKVLFAGVEGYSNINQNAWILEKPVTVENCMIKGLATPIFDAMKYSWALNELNIKKSIIQMNNDANSFINMDGAGCAIAKVMNITENTIYNLKDNESKFFIKGSNASNTQPKKIYGTTAADTYVWTISNNTMVKTFSKKAFANSTPSINTVTIAMKSNIFLDVYQIQKLFGNCKKDYEKNIIWGKEITIDGTDKGTYCTESNPGFVAPTAALDLTAENGGIDLKIGASTLAAKYEAGDPRWKVAFTGGYTITMGTVTNGTVEAGGTSPYAAGEKVRLTLTPAEGYAIDNKPTFKNDEDVDVTELVTVGQDADGFYLVMPAFNITASYAFSKLYTITLPTETTHGTITIVKPEGTNKSVAGKLIKIKVTGLSDGYKVVAKNGDTDITLNEGDHATYDYYFEMPEGDVTISIVDATGINAISVDGAADIFADGKPVYNLAGQRVFKGYKGLVIKNGKKVVVK